MVPSAIKEAWVKREKFNSQTSKTITAELKKRISMRRLSEQVKAKSASYIHSPSKDRENYVDLKNHLKNEKVALYMIPKKLTKSQNKPLKLVIKDEEEMEPPQPYLPNT